MPFAISRRAVLQAMALLPAAGPAAWAATGAPHHGFTHGVASGNPASREVTLWTRFVPKDGGEARLRVELAADPQFARVLSRGIALAGPATDYCVHARPEGLRPGRWYYYRFRSDDGVVSVTGRTRTLPAGSPKQFRIAVVSCSNATSGWFNAYAHAAARDDLDLLLHTGDYIYESPIDRADALAEVVAARGIQPRGETVALAEYRLRYATYRTDPALQELHRQFPMIAIWDDHEVANNSWKGGASNHQPEEGRWVDRVAAARRAWREWMPMRGGDYDSYQIGDLATLFRLETRLVGRSRQLDLKAALAGAPNRGAATTAFRNGPLVSTDRTLMGGRQEQWLADGLASSTSGGTHWQILAQQVIMAPTRLPEVSSAWFPAGTQLDARRQAELAESVAFGQLGMPLDLDRWDGYPAARARLLDAAARARANLVVLSGDSHNGWAYDLARARQPVGVEFAGQSVSSLGIERRFAGDPQQIARDFIAANDGLRWCDTSRRGYMVLDLTPERATNEWLFVPSRESCAIVLQGSHKMAVEYGARKLAIS